MAEYIDREKAKSLLHIEYAYAAEQLLDEIPAADVPRWCVDGGYTSQGITRVSA